MQILQYCITNYKAMLKIENLTVTTQDKTILDNLNLDLKQGKIYVISGQNGSGKSTLAQAIMGNPEYDISDSSQIILTKKGEDFPLQVEFATPTQVNLVNLTPDQRSQLGVFVSMQYPTEIPGVNLLIFLKHIIQINRQSRGLTKLNTKQTMDLIYSKLDLIDWSKKFLGRNVNEGMSGGERKKCEILQMLLLDPQLIILDEIDSGLDKEALELIVKVVLDFMNERRTLIIITHQQRILDMIKPNKIFKMKAGRVIE
jgi:Fe-S cluster assembly ATP-binding protein